MVKLEFCNRALSEKKQQNLLFLFLKIVSLLAIMRVVKNTTRKMPEKCPNAKNLIL
jgi:hypothetical protein